MRILVALDSSPRAPSVLAAAARFPEARLVLYRAITVPPDFPRELLAVTDARLDDLLAANARNDLERLAAAVDPKRIDALATAFATPWDGICRAAREYACDLIVIGSHGYGGLDRVLGTCAAKVVNHADRDVYVVKPAS